MLTIAFVIIVVHFVADFVLQTDKQAKGKSKNWGDLLSHTYIYSMVWIIVGIIYAISLKDSYQEWDVTSFVAITFACHTLQDYFTSRLNSRLWADGKVHNFFVSVGFDQVLHYGQLFLTYHLIFNN